MTHDHGYLVCMTTTNQTLAGVTEADTIARIVLRCIIAKVWRSACETEAIAYAARAERKIVIAYVKEQYDAAGAGYSGRWQ